MRLLLLLLACATTNPVYDRPPKNFEECEQQCKPQLDLCTARCSMAVGSTLNPNAMGAAECRNACWDRDTSCHAECKERFKN